MACGDKHTLVLYDDGSVWSAGQNEAGQLGRQGEEHVFAKIEALSNHVITQVLVTQVLATQVLVTQVLVTQVLSTQVLVTQVLGHIGTDCYIPCAHWCW